eukprot:Protomagalhaensia_wolfi_Nauph_80__874@NODE_1503_length_1498_cov_8_697053_g1163_i0_p1_GENE_NODE_1503_length_1498_cov_8_697053_g1163_i0NODE_1503_length_1498_cov_8_697053_g1163_i0_p1_ORF_typecomplete_len416_score87_31TFIIF_alpha/PF05793_12/7_7e09HTH_11/PF08279_12/0_0096HTH_Mga/PF08280_11/0_13_NODE_1503_length_1498_cov_8_697053_g1163_i02341481
MYRSDNDDLHPPGDSQIHVPPELQPHLKSGKPIIMGKHITSEGPPGQRMKERTMYLCRVPTGNVAETLTPPIMLSHKTSWEDDVDDVGNPTTTKGERVLEIEDSTKVLWTGKRDAGRASNFVLFDRGTHWELFPVAGSFTFVTDMSRFVGNQEADEVERQQRMRLARDRAADIAIASRIAKEDDDTPMMSNKRNRVDLDEPFESAPANVTLQKKARLQKILRKKRAAKDLDIGTTAASSLAVGEVRKAEHDWDFDDGGVATDDEGQDVMSDHEALEKDVEDVEDSEEEKEDVVLTNYGESLNRMLQHQKEVEADEELAQFSEDEDDEEKQKGSVVGSATGERRPPAAPPGHRPGGPSALAAAAGDDGEGIERRRIIELLKSNNNQITVKSLLEALGVTAKNSKFHTLKVSCFCGG